MTDHETIPPDADDEIRTRLQALGRQVAERADAEAVLQRLPRRTSAPTVRLLAFAACLLAVVLVVALVVADTDPVETVGQPEPPTPTADCPATSQPRAITQGEPMHKTLGTIVASTATAAVLFGGCGDDGATADNAPAVIAKGEDIELVGDGAGIESQTLNIDVQEKDGEVTGQFQVTDNVMDVECVDTDTDGIVILGGVASHGPDVKAGDLLALVIREGEPDAVALFANESGATTCAEMIDSVPADVRTAPDGNPAFTPLEAGSDITTS